MSSVVCRMVCNDIRTNEWGSEVFLTPVVVAGEEKDSEIKEFFEATPGGSLHLYIKNEAAVKHLTLGSHYYVTLEPVKSTTHKEKE